MKDGDWVYHDFELGQIVDDGSHTTGYIRSGGKRWMDEYIPLTIKSKLISEEYKAWYDKLHELKFNALNFPDIHGWMCSHWLETCRNIDQPKEYFEKRYNEVRVFCNNIMEACRDFQLKEVNGIRLGR